MIAIPILIYHNIGYVKENSAIDLDLINSTTDVNDNGFRVLTMSDLGYNQTIMKYK